ncbi:MAG: hypothetical protein JRN09_00840 [Nitrososphaerota archaeon]|jgi:hypothetical protein|nr:hypothetical protein [Nitrososphaerota archaeon]
MAQDRVDFHRVADPAFLKVTNDNRCVPPGLRGLKVILDWKSLRQASLLVVLQDKIAALT